MRLKNSVKKCPFCKDGDFFLTEIIPLEYSDIAFVQEDTPNSRHVCLNCGFEAMFYSTRERARIVNGQ